MSNPKVLKQEILRLTREYSRQVHGAFRPAADPERQPWKAGSPIPYAGLTDETIEAEIGVINRFCTQ